jgi:hypothetical protein
MTMNKRFEDWQAEQMKDPEFRAAVKRLEPEFQAERLYIKHRRFRYWLKWKYHQLLREIGLK